ncbi:Undecaprenyl-diphosphatase BcrC [uncultured Eubacterium sp.]|nr:Undecaprenyl-diphosphatase BcrC [uncultured Eubacterium sp.]
MERIDREKLVLRSVIIGGALICFAYIAYTVMSCDVLGYDTAIREWVYGLRSPLRNRILICITYLGNWQTIVMLGLALLIYPGTRRKIGLPFAVTAISSTVIYKIAKSIFQRPRPDLSVRIIEESGYSFPSGHSMNCMVIYGILIYLTRRYCKNRTAANWITVLLGLLILVIGCSRVYVGVHFPTDILGGWSLGIAVLTAAIMIIERIRGGEYDH